MREVRLTAELSGRVVTLTVEGHDLGRVCVSWGDGWRDVIDGQAAASTADHEYPAAGLYTVEVVDRRGHIGRTTVDVAEPVPGGGDPAAAGSAAAGRTPRQRKPRKGSS